MISLIPLSRLLFGSVVAGAVLSICSMAVAETNAACEDPNMLEICQATCLSNCNNVGFFQTNASYCLADRSWSTGRNAAYADAGTCPLSSEGAGASIQSADRSSTDLSDASGTETVATEETSVASKPFDVADDCAAIQNVIERSKCIRNKEIPPCASSVFAPEQDATILSRTIESELAKFGDLLSGELEEVSNRNLLCRFSLEELGRQHEEAESNPGALAGLQQNATSIQACQTSWENYLETRGAPGVPDDLDNDLIENSREQLGGLKGQIGALTTSIDTLERASETIQSLIYRHMDFCDPAGTPITE